MLFNIDMDRFMSTVTKIPDASKLIDIDTYMNNNNCTYVPTDFTSFAMNTVEHVSSSGLLLYGGILHIDGWDYGRPAKRRMKWNTKQEMIHHASSILMTRGVKIFERLLLEDPDRECGWAVILHIHEPTSQRNTGHIRSTCLFMVDRNNHSIEFDPLGPMSSVKVVANIGFKVLKDAYNATVSEQHVVSVIEDTSMFIMKPDDYRAAIWCIYMAFHVVNSTFDRVRRLSPDELLSDFADFNVLLPQHIAAAVLILHKYTNKILQDNN